MFNINTIYTVHYNDHIYYLQFARELKIKSRLYYNEYCSNKFYSSPFNVYDHITYVTEVVEMSGDGKEIWVENV